MAQAVILHQPGCDGRIHTTHDPRSIHADGLTISELRVRMPKLPSQADLNTLLSTARRMAEGADQLLLDGYGRVTASQKSDGSLVTQTDHAVDAFLTSELKATFPDHAILSEEGSTQYDPRIEFTWVVDPLDGTTNFARGLPIWGVSIALLWVGSPVVGLLSFPSLRETYSAVHRGGATANDSALYTSPLQVTDNQHFMMQCTRTARRYQIRTQLKPRILGSAAYHLVAVANGNALAGIESTPKLWDIAAALLILTEAGGCYQRLDTSDPIFPLPDQTANYEKLSFPLLAAANPAILNELEPNIVYLS